MSFLAITLILAGISVIVISLMNSRHCTSDVDNIAIHKGMSDARIGKEFSQRRKRVDAGMGLLFGALVLLTGIFVQILYSWLWGSF